LVAHALGLKVTDLLSSSGCPRCAGAASPELPDLVDEVEEANGQPARIL
jgi:hypothetical protein